MSKENKEEEVGIIKRVAMSPTAKWIGGGVAAVVVVGGAAKAGEVYGRNKTLQKHGLTKAIGVDS